MTEILTNEEMIRKILNDAFASFSTGKFHTAAGILEKGIEIDFEDESIISFLKYANFWVERKGRSEEIDDLFEKGEFFLKEWKNFISFQDRNISGTDEDTYAIRHWVFGKALEAFLIIEEKNRTEDTEILFRIGKCYKGKGDYGKALEYLEKVNQKRRDDPGIIAELADCYAFVDEMKISKAFFREAFFIDSQRIDIYGLESLFMKRLIKRVAQMGYSQPVLSAWVPVFGVIYGIFNVKRELRPIEYGKLKQSIFQLETRIKDDVTDIEKELLIPRLIYRYFWLIDHHISSGDSRDKTETIILRIKKLDSSVYELYNN